MEPRPRGEQSEHSLAAWLAIAAILLSAGAIFGAHVELNGTQDLERLVEEMPLDGAQKPAAASPQGTNREESREAAVASGRWATGFFSG